MTNDQIPTITITLENDEQLSCEVLGMKEIDGLTYIALDPPHTDDIWLYEYVRLDDDFRLKTIDSDVIFEKLRTWFYDTHMSKSHTSNKIVSNHEKCSLDELLDLFGFKFKAKRLKPLFKTAIGFKYAEGHVIIGQTKIGGKPDTSKDFVWPVIKRKPLNFLAQVNLRDLKDLDEDHLLPDTGMLYFFFNAKDGATFSEGENHQVIYDPVSTNLTPYKKHRKTYREVGFDFARRYTVLEDEDLDLYLDAEEDEDRLFEEMLNFIYTDTQLLGHPNIVQNDPRDAIKDYAEVDADKEDWMLLFQVDEFTHEALDFVDCGVLYFYIRKADLLRKDFRHTIMILQYA